MQKSKSCFDILLKILYLHSKNIEIEKKYFLKDTFYFILKEKEENRNMPQPPAITRNYQVIGRNILTGVPAVKKVGFITIINQLQFTF